MPRYYFHLCAPDERFPDPEGSEIADLAEAHSRAVRLADRVMMFGGFAKCQPDLRRWTVEITDERQEPVLIVIFPAHFKKHSDVERLNGAHALQQRVSTSSDEKQVPFTARCGFEPRTTPVESPQSNGMAEAFVRTMKRDYARVSSLADAETVIRQLPAHPSYRSPREFIASRSNRGNMSDL
jgi:hypothetical protein